ncbi:MAG: hypothetical protein JWO78_2374 [Micavibrio sp.]|nr:hypothetical protein [Micavibrio sp.]
MPADLLIYALVAAGLIFWLRSVLGTRSGEERERPNPYQQKPGNDIPGLPVGIKEITPGETIIANPLSLPKNSNCSIASPVLETVLLSIAGQDRRFTLEHFANGAQDAFVMIVEAFAQGNRELLKNLLAPDLFKSFDDALTARAASGETMTAEIHAIRKVEINDAQIKNKTAYITVRFIADETVVTRDRDNNIISGNPDRVTETIDIWTFGKPVNTKDPTWYLIATREEEASPVPTPTITI